MNDHHINISQSDLSLNCTIKDFSAEIIRLISAQNQDKLYIDFVKNFLTYIPVDYSSEDKIQLFINCTWEAFKFFREHLPWERKIEIIKTQFQNQYFISILIIADDKPFIIDSITSLLTRLNLRPVFIFHPLLTCQRDKSGNLITIDHQKTDQRKTDQQNIQTNNITKESLIFIKTPGAFSKKMALVMSQEINKIIDLVDKTCNSWQPILIKLAALITDITSNIEHYSKTTAAHETVNFLNWLQKDNFTFLGIIDFEPASAEITSQEGVREIWQDNLSELRNIIILSKSESHINKLAIAGKINTISPIHRNALVDYILIKKFDDQGVYSAGTIIFGLYGTAMYYNSIETVPILGNKMDYVLDRSGFNYNSYNWKKLKNIIESLPRDILIQIDESELYCICLHMLSSLRSYKLKLFIQQSQSNSFINILIFFPKKYLTSEVHHDIIDYLTKIFAGEVVNDNITVVQNFCHLFATVAVKTGNMPDFSTAIIEEELTKITANWGDSLRQLLHNKYGEYAGEIKYKAIEPLFSHSYRHKFTAEVAVTDFEHLVIASRSGQPGVSLIQSTDSEFFLKIYSAKTSLTLSEILPLIENLGFIAIDQQSFTIAAANNIKTSRIYEFRLSSPGVIEFPFDLLKQNVEEALEKIHSGSFTSDSLSKLIVLAGFNWMQVKLVRALTRYLHQTNFTYGKGYVQLTLIKHYNFTKMLVEFFAAKFDPQLHSINQTAMIVKQVHKYLNAIESQAEDKVLRSMYLIIEAMVRTNYYQEIKPYQETKHYEEIKTPQTTLANNQSNTYNDSNDQQLTAGIKEYLSFKFDSKKVPDLNLPIPYAEIFVYSNEFEAIHLRGGKVSRGGIRWSDRGEDYRTEVLGLFKAQMLKNTVIVPVGAKGTFYLNFTQGKLSREEYLHKVINCYQNFLRGLLDLTDNIIQGQIVKPLNTITYDEDDPYLVVAADKGTASFSDFANLIAKEYNFWLGDAFASGGYSGYDHKKMGITAKGAWVSAVHHGYNINLDINRDYYKAVGIGDMSGDVFGNGLLLSRSIKLVAAFNHEHIFIDPEPDSTISYYERKRLFITPYTKWSDYNPDLISPGGGVFIRTAKILTISQEIMNLLGLTKKTITPDDLIKAILKADVDLIWNGGIGTYVKSALENNPAIGDKANDNVRVNGNEIRARIICEGGNLGLSQSGRIEYALKGGCINTDFIDNSAGVDCSDHEVNIKIALNNAVATGKISLETRNDILEKMTRQVEELVLADNYSQNQALTIAQFSPFLNIESFGQLIMELEEEGLLVREGEFLPGKTELTSRALLEEQLTRPELAVLLSYSKMSVAESLADTVFLSDEYLQGEYLQDNYGARYSQNKYYCENRPYDQYFQKYLFDYFPELMRQEFAIEIIQHPLRQEIIKTIITNNIINRLSGPIVNIIKKETGARTADIIRAYVIICELFNLDKLWQRVDKIDSNIDIKLKVKMFADISKIIQRGINWFIRNIRYNSKIIKLLQNYSRQTQLLTNVIDQFLVGEAKIKFLHKIETYQHGGVDVNLATDLALLDIAIAAVDIIYIARVTNSNNMDVAPLYFISGDRLSIDWLRRVCEAQADKSYWNRLAIQSIKDDLYDKQRYLLIKIITDAKKNLPKNLPYTEAAPEAEVKELWQEVILTNWLENNKAAVNIFSDFIHSIRTQDNIDLNMLILANKKLQNFLEKLE